MIRQLFDLNGKTALILGGRGFLGRHFASTLHEFGARVFSGDLPVLSCAAKHDHTSVVSGKGIEQLDVDVTDQASVSSLLQSMLSVTEHIDVMVLCVTTKPADFFQPFTECSLEGWKKVLAVELDGAFVATQQVGRIMEKQNSGSIIFISSMYGVVGNDQRIYQSANLAQLYTDTAGDPPKQIFSHAAYNTAKGGLISLARFLAAYWGHKNIRVNVISPGGVAHSGENKTFVDAYTYRTPLGRKAEISDLCGAVAFLASDASSYITGHNLIIDGGWTAW